VNVDIGSLGFNSERESFKEKKKVTMEVRGKVIYLPLRKATFHISLSLNTMHDTDDLDAINGKCPRLYTAHWSSAIWKHQTAGAQWWELRVWSGVVNIQHHR
jgi:hypothetical protein